MKAESSQARLTERLAALREHLPRLRAEAQAAAREAHAQLLAELESQAKGAVTDSGGDDERPA